MSRILKHYLTRLIRTSDYTGTDAIINMYKDYIEKHQKSIFKPFAEDRLKQLKEEKLLEEH